MAKAMKFDDGKAPIDLVDSTIILELAKVLGFGAEKYEAHNWKEGLPISRYYSAAMRHMMAFNDGETIDPESELNHLSHAACNLMFMLYMLKNKPGLDDRPERFLVGTPEESVIRMELDMSCVEKALRDKGLVE